MLICDHVDEFALPQQPPQRRIRFPAFTSHFHGNRHPLATFKPENQEGVGCRFHTLKRYNNEVNGLDASQIKRYIIVICGVVLGGAIFGVANVLNRTVSPSNVDFGSLARLGTHSRSLDGR